MTGFALPELSPTAAPEFVDADECKAWIEHVPLANVAAAQQQLLGQLEEFNRFPTSAANRFSVMEALREPANFVQIEQAKRFTNRALPMAEAEAAVFEDTNELWEQMHMGYLRCRTAWVAGRRRKYYRATAAGRKVLAEARQKLHELVGEILDHKNPKLSGRTRRRLDSRGRQVTPNGRRAPRSRP